MSFVQLIWSDFSEKAVDRKTFQWEATHVLHYLDNYNRIIGEESQRTVTDTDLEMEQYRQTVAMKVDMLARKEETRSQRLFSCFCVRSESGSH